MADEKCCLCGEDCKEGDDTSSYRVEGDCKGFECTFNLKKCFHNACISKADGINEIARAQVLDYLEAVEFSKSVTDELKTQNLERADKLLKQIQWRQKYPRKGE